MKHTHTRLCHVPFADIEVKRKACRCQKVTSCTGFQLRWRQLKSCGSTSGGSPFAVRTACLRINSRGVSCVPTDVFTSASSSAVSDDVLLWRRPAAYKCKPSVPPQPPHNHHLPLCVLIHECSHRLILKAPLCSFITLLHWFTGVEGENQTKKMKRWPHIVTLERDKNTVKFKKMTLDNLLNSRQRLVPFLKKTAAASPLCAVSLISFSHEWAAAAAHGYFLITARWRRWRGGGCKGMEGGLK